MLAAVRSRRGRRWLAWTAVALGAAVLLLGGGGAWAFWSLGDDIEARLKNGVEGQPSRLYSRPIALVPGSRVHPDVIARHLRRTGYRAADEVPRAGEFRLSASRWEIAQRPFSYPDGLDIGGPVTLELDRSGAVRAIRGSGDRARAAILLEPERIGVLHSERAEDRRPVTLDRVPEALVHAVLAVEDQRFFRHPGVDWRRVVGAARANFREGAIVEGASTLTQQLVKNVYLSPERTWRRKLRELVMALALELRHDKTTILEAYLSEIYLGQNGALAIHGVESASWFYFNKSAVELTTAECALLAGLIRAPSYDSPLRHPERARARRDLVLSRMLQQGRIGASVHDAAVAEPIRLQRRTGPRTALHFVDWTRRRLGQQFDRAALEGGGLSIFTTLDPLFQRAAERAIADGLADLQERHRRLHEDGLQAALVALDPHTGDVLALVGGRDYGESQFNRAVEARRQPGSAFKPVVALAALAPRDFESPITLATLLDDEPVEFETNEGPWRPRNYDGEFLGRVSLRDALEQSRNVPFVNLGRAVGLKRVVQTARRLGVSSRLRAVPSLALGAFETTPLELAGVYAVFASGGVRSEPRTTLAVLAADGAGVYADPSRSTPVFDAAETFLVTSALEGAIARGTGRALRADGFGGPVAGKTGTTNDFRDAWFAAYTPNLAVVVWVGFDDGRSLGLSGARAALPLARRFLTEALGSRGGAAFQIPPGLTLADVEPASGLRAAYSCPGLPEWFLEGTSPDQTCASGRPRRSWRWVFERWWNR